MFILLDTSISELFFFYCSVWYLKLLSQKENLKPDCDLHILSACDFGAKIVKVSLDMFYDV